jgi:hypothetical protein
MLAEINHLWSLALDPPKKTYSQFTHLAASGLCRTLRSDASCTSVCDLRSRYNC